MHKEGHYCTKNLPTSSYIASCPKFSHKHPLFYMKKSSKNYSFMFKKKLQPATKAWKSLTATLQTHLPTAIAAVKTAAARGLSAVLRSLLPLKRRLIMLKTNKRRRSFSHNHFRHYNGHGTIYIDELYEENKVVSVGEGKETGGSSIMRRFDVEEAWREVVAGSPELRPVDERAEDFICKVREEMKIESQRSIVEFHDMLKRSV